MKYFKCVFLTILVAFAAPTWSDISFDEFMRMQGSPSKQLNEAADIYANGLLDGIMWTYSFAGESADKPFCLPQSAELNRDDLVRHVVSFLETIESSASSSEMGLVAVFALQHAYPCIK